MLPQREIPPDPFESAFDQLGKDFQTKYGRSWEVTGGADTPPHQKFRQGKARDVRSRTLKREEIDFVISRGAELGLRVKDFSNLTGPMTSSTGVQFTGPHLHIEHDEVSGGFNSDVDSILQKYGVGSSRSSKVEEVELPPRDKDPLADYDNELNSILGRYGIGQVAQSGETRPAIWNKEDPGYATNWNVQRMIDEGVEETKHLPGSTKLIESNGQPVPLHQPVTVTGPSPYRLTVAGLGDGKNLTPEALKTHTLQSLGFSESAAKSEQWEFRIPHEEILKRITNGTLEVDIPQEEADYLRGRAEEAKRAEEFLKTASNGGQMTAAQIAVAAGKPGIKPRVEQLSTVTGKPAQKPLPYDVAREVTAQTTLADLPERATRPLQYLSTLTAGAQRAIGAEVSDMLGLSKNARAGYGPLDILDAAAERFYTGKVRPGYEQPVAELYKRSVERFGGDPDSAFNKLMRDTLELGTDPVNLAMMGSTGPKAAQAADDLLPRRTPAKPASALDDIVIDNPNASAIADNLSANSTAAKSAGQSSGIISKAKARVSEFLKREPDEKRASILEVVSTFRKAGLITGVKTQARNIGGNTAFQVAEEISRMPAAMVDLGMSVITGRRTVQGLNPAAVWRSTRAAATEGIEEARNILRTGATPSQLAAYSVPDEIVTGSKILDTFINGSFRLQAAEDAVFKRFAASRSLQEQAMLMAKDEAKRGLIKRANISGRADEILQGVGVNADDYALMQARAVEDAAFATFQNPNMVMDAVERGIQKLPQPAKFAVDVVAPFRKTPANIIARVLDYTPVGAAKGTARLARSITKGAFTEAEQAAFAKAMGRATTGTATIMLGFKLREKGLLTGFVGDGWSEESKKRAWNERRLMEAEGKLPGAVRIGDQWIEVGRYSPLGNLLALGAAMYDRHEKGEGLAVAGAKEFGNVALDQPLLESTKEIPDIFNDPGRYTKNQLGSFVPTIAADIAGQMDTTERGTGEEFHGAAQKRIPGAREKLPVRVDIFGEQMKPSSNLNPFAVRSAKDMPAMKEIKRLGLEVFAPERFPADTDQIYLKRAKQIGETRKHNLRSVTESARYSNPPSGIDADTFNRAALKEAIYAESKVKTGEEDLIFHNARVRVERDRVLDEARHSSEYKSLNEAQRKEFERGINLAFFPAKAERSANDGGVNLLLKRRENTLSGLLRNKQYFINEALERARPKKSARVTSSVDDDAHRAATSPANDLAEPTRAQKSVGNYAKGHTRISGLEITIENPQGSKRRPEWPAMKSHYGYIRRTQGGDGEHIDVFIRPGTSTDYSGPVYVVDQMKKDGGFDEHKALLGFDSEKSARAGYLENYTKDWKGLGSIREFASVADFKEWLKNADTTKPAAQKRPSLRA
jgi:hypothetical protein